LPCGRSLRKIAKAWQFNRQRLQEALAPEINFNQYIGEVNYIDYKKEHIPFDDLFFPFYSNGKVQYEGEVRILTDIGDSTVKSTKV
jgi:hypothetical protein